jgi:hypothetical protein
VDRDGFISNGELFLVLKMMVGNNLKVCIRLPNDLATLCNLFFETGPTIAADC